MKLTTDANQKIIFTDGETDYSLAEYAKMIRLDTGLATGTLESFSGIDHPKYYTMERGTYQSVIPLLVALDFLGYEITITRGADTDERIAKAQSMVSDPRQQLTKGAK